MEEGNCLCVAPEHKWREGVCIHRGKVYGALARAEALVANHPDWMNVTQWPLEDGG